MAGGGIGLYEDETLGTVGSALPTEPSFQGAFHCA